MRARHPVPANRGVRGEGIGQNKRLAPEEGMSHASLLLIFICPVYQYEMQFQFVFHNSTSVVNNRTPHRSTEIQINT